MDRLIAHVFIDDTGKLTVTPCVRISEEDEERLKAVWRHRFVSVSERLANAREA